MFQNFQVAASVYFWNLFHILLAAGEKILRVFVLFQKAAGYTHSWNSIISKKPKKRKKKQWSSMHIFASFQFLSSLCFFFLRYSLKEIEQKFRNEFWGSYIGTLGFWIPGCLGNFYFVPVQFRILFLCWLSFCHKFW